MKWYYELNDFDELEKYIQIKYPNDLGLERIYKSTSNSIKTFIIQMFYLASDEADNSPDLKYLIYKSNISEFSHEYKRIEKEEFEEQLEILKYGSKMSQICSCGRKTDLGFSTCTCKFEQEELCNCCSKCRSK